MGRMLMYGALAIGAFGLAAGGSWFLNQKEEPAEEADENADESGEVTDDQTDDAGKSDNSKTDKKPGEPIASAVPPRPMSAEDLYRIGEIMKAREKAIKEREEALEKRDRQLKLVLIDIDAEQRETDGLFTQVRGTLDAATKRLQQFQLETQNAMPKEDTKEKPDAADDTEDDGQPTPDQIKQAKKLAVIYQSMAPEQAAAKLTKIADNGDVDLVVRIARYFEDRKAAKILAGLDDALHQQVVSLLAEVKQVAKKDAE